MGELQRYDCETADNGRDWSMVEDDDGPFVLAGDALAEVDRLKAELTTLHGKTGSCMECERLAREIAKLRAAGEALAERARAYREWQKIPAPKRNHVEPLKDILRDLAGLDFKDGSRRCRCGKVVEVAKVDGGGDGE